MKLYFKDCNDAELRRGVNEWLKIDKIMCRGDGYGFNQAVLRSLDAKAVVLSNDEELLDFFWEDDATSEIGGRWNVYFIDVCGLRSAQSLTEKELRKGHSISKMYKAGCFGKD